MRVIIEDNPDNVICKVSMRRNRHGKNVSCSTYSNCDNKTKQRVKTLLMAVLIRITNGELDKQAQELLERVVLE